MTAVRAVWGLCAAAAVALLTAFWVEHVMGYAPCQLCLYQRPPYVAAVVIGLAGGLFASAADQQRRVLWLLAALFATTAAIAAFHVGVEQRWWEGLSGCAGSGAQAGSTQDLFAALSSPPPASCTDATVVLFGISMAGYNALVAAGLAVLSALAACRLAAGEAQEAANG